MKINFCVFSDFVKKNCLRGDGLHFGSGGAEAI